MSFLQTLGLKLLGADALAVIKGEVVQLTRATVAAEQDRAEVDTFVPRSRLEKFFQYTLNSRAQAGANQVTSALLKGIVGDHALLITNAARDAEASGEGFMKKKAAVLKVIKEFVPTLTKSQQQLVIELAVQLAKD
jgi:hypothetical protein